MNSLKEEVVQYLSKVTGRGFRLRPLANTTQKLPLFIRHLYKLWELERFGGRIVLAAPTTTENHTPGELAKHCDLLQRALGVPVALVLSDIASYNRNRLVRMRVPFIIPGRQLFLPSMLIDLNETRITPKPLRAGISAATQTVVLYRLLCGNINELTLAELAQKLGYSAMTLTKAAAELGALELADVATAGRKRHIYFHAAGLELWKMAEPHLKSPVKDSHWVAGTAPRSATLFLAGVTALEKVSSLTGDSLPVMAQKTSHVRSLLDDGILKECPDQDEADTCLQEWRYDPAPFAEGKSVDRLSLYLALRETADERVRLALREMMEAVTWQS